MSSRRTPMLRVLPGKVPGNRGGMQPARHDAPRLVRNTVVDFSSLNLPEDVRLALAEAFWNHVGIRPEHCIHTHWFHIKTFDRFARESGALVGLVDLNRDLLVRYIEWLNAQCRPDGQPWTKYEPSGRVHHAAQVAAVARTLPTRCDRQHRVPLQPVSLEESRRTATQQSASTRPASYLEGVRGGDHRHPRRARCSTRAASGGRWHAGHPGRAA